MLPLSNLYASQIFSEHPISLYPLDDDVYYISLINDEQRFFSSGGWSVTSGSATFQDNPELPELASPFKDNHYTKITCDIEEDSIIEIESPPIFQLRDLNETLSSFSISMFLYQSSFFVEFYEVGYRYYDEILEENKDVFFKVEASQGREWVNFDFSYLPHDYDNTEIKLLLRFSLKSGGEEEDYSFIVNGINVGQWSENFSSQFSGVIPTNNPIDLLGIPARQYGIQEDSGFYIVENNSLLAKNQGPPMVYGSKTSTKIYASEQAGHPSMIFPGKGFLNNSGKQNQYTFEFWLKIKPNTKQEKRIFGPIDSTDGIYVNEGFISLSIGNNFATHYVSQWYRPMLIHVSLELDSASLLINGERVLSIPYNRSELFFPDDNDWVGFYSYNKIEFFSIDCVAIYPYAIATDVAKRRFVYGQGTPSPEGVAESFDGITSYINFSNSNYGVNKIYPDLALWEAGYSNNIKTTKSSISVPDYQLPEIFVEGRNIQDLYEDNKIANEIEEENFFTFRPNIEGGTLVFDGVKWSEPSYLFFNNLSIVDDLSAIYGVFSAKDINSYSPLMIIRNSTNFDKFEIFLENGFIKYKFNNDVLVENQLFDNSENSGYGGYYQYNEEDDWEYSFAFGIDIQRFSNGYNNTIKDFFQSPNNLQAYFAGNGSETFKEKIYSIGFSNSLNFENIKDLFLDNGTADNFEYEDLINHVATYTLSPFIRFNHFFLDISIDALWEEYFPLSSFASFVYDYEGNQYYDLDFLQINLGYPSVTEIVEKLRSQFDWNYTELFLEFNSPVKKSYSILDNSDLSSYDIYEDLITKNVIEKFFNTEDSGLRTYLTFQLLSEGANRPLEDFPYERDLVSTKFINPNLEISGAIKNRPLLTKYEFIDKTIVFPPRITDFNKLAIVFHFKIKQRGILSNPLVVRDFEIVSRSLNHNEFTSIGSESGFPFYSYVKAGIYFENKTQNPVLISKKRSPYLYLTEDDGLSVLGNPTYTKEYGVATPINEGRSDNYPVSAIQSWIKYDLLSFSVVPYPIFEIQSIDKTIEFIIRSDSSGKRGVVVARNKKTREIEQNITYYQNGIRVKNPIFEKGEWSSLGVIFDDELIFNQYTGYINFFRGVTFNNISHYRPSGLGKTLEIVARPWRRVLSATDNEGENFSWSVWYVKDNIETRMRTNLAYNPNFEESLDGWEALGTGTEITRIQDDSRFGQSSARCITGASNSSGLIFANQSGQRISISPNTEYGISVYVRVPQGYPNKNLRIVSRQYSSVSGGSLLSTENQQAVQVSGSDGWVRIFSIINSLSTANALSIEISQEIENEIGSEFYVDGLLVEDTSSLQPKINRYFDGSYASPGLLAEQLVWNGTENNSTSTVVYFVPGPNDIRQWSSVYALSERTVFSLNPGDIYKAYIGTNGVVFDDNEGISIDAESLSVYSSINWSRIIDKPV
jgi:hypothetical protein